VLSLGHLSLHKQRKGRSRPEGGRKPLILFLLLLPVSQMPTGKSKQMLSLPFGERVTFLCLCKEKITKRKHTLPTRLPRCALQVHSASRIFRRYIPVSSKNDVRPARRPVRGLVCQLRRCGRGPGRAKALEQRQKQRRMHPPEPRQSTPPIPSPTLCVREGNCNCNCKCKCKCGCNCNRIACRTEHRSAEVKGWQHP